MGVTIIIDWDGQKPLSIIMKIITKNMNIYKMTDATSNVEQSASSEIIIKALWSHEYGLTLCHIHFI